MSTKTFKSSNGTNRDLFVGTFQGDIQLVIEKGQGSLGVVLSPALAPAVMLAISSAASIVHHDPEDTPCEPSQRTENMGDLNMAVFYLARHVNQAEKAAHIAAKEAADLEVLEGEAQALHQAAAEMSPFPAKWEDILPASKNVWIAVAKHARDLHGGTK